jgi:hypothetical protein
MSTPRSFETSVCVKSDDAQHNIPEEQNPEHAPCVNLQHRTAFWYHPLKQAPILPWKLYKIIAVFSVEILVGAV